MRSLSRFYTLLTQPAPPDCFNPWLQHDAATDACRDAPARRLARLMRHLDCRARFLLVGEAPGYQGAKVSGIPFTSERLMGEGVIPRIALGDARLSTRARPWSEPSATIVWKALHELGIADQTILWNAFPWHPYKAGQLHSNRTPTPGERGSGRPVLLALLRAFPDARLFAIGRQAEHTLGAMGLAADPLRHPSMGGATAFRNGLRAATLRTRASPQTR
jgi:uracil-DNA glycosylase